VIRVASYAVRVIIEIVPFVNAKHVPRNVAQYFATGFLLSKSIFDFWTLANTEMPSIYVALIHYPVLNKNADIIASAVTNLDLHDISRAAKTYGVKRFYVVTPLTDQIELAKRIISHWTNGAGASYNPDRRSALELICIKESLDEVAEHIFDLENTHPETVATCAKKHQTAISYEKLRNDIKNGRPYLLVFGTAWGLAEETIHKADYILEPIAGNTAYNHLSVRSAAAIILDRLLGVARE
jgi:hypothetical protein